MDERDIVADAEAIINESRQKNQAIKRHYRVVTDPNASSEDHGKVLESLGILSRDTKKPVIILNVDSMARLGEKNQLPKNLLTEIIHSDKK